MQTVKAEATARKSLGEYKPVIKIGRRTEVLQQNPERAARQTADGRINGNRYARGTTYTRRADAIAVAQQAISDRLDRVERQLLDLAYNRPNGDHHYVAAQVTMYGGDPDAIIAQAKAERAEDDGAWADSE